MKVRFIDNRPLDDGYKITTLELGEIYTVFTIYYDSEKTYYNLMSSDSGYLAAYNAKRFEISDNKKPDFWISKTDRRGNTLNAPIKWHSSGFFERLYEGYKKERYWFYKDCRDLYNINIKFLKDDTYTYNKNFNAICISKEAYLKPTEQENTFIFIDNHNEFDITLNKIYKVYEKKDIWYKIIDDKENKSYYSKYMFKQI